LHVYDGAHRHAGDQRLQLDNGAGFASDVATGYGPECFTARGAEIAYPYLLQAKHASQGAMGHSIGAAHVLRIDSSGQATLESHPFVVMNDGAVLPLGELASAREPLRH
jgi:hypothetical protein